MITTPNNLPPLEPLSPAAKVLDAFLNNYTCRPSGNVAFEADRNGLAAALRAAAEQIIEEVSPVEAILAIATELECKS
jgi:hypothetical protein